nr:ComEA family DNA-binding protein [uncultured Desulfobacter sp.]
MKTRSKKIAAILVCMLAVLYMTPVMGQGRINLNTASKEQLMTMKGVGEAIAQRIIEYREATPFQTIEDIVKVKGVGAKILEANKHLISVTDE